MEVLQAIVLLSLVVMVHCFPSFYNTQGKVYAGKSVEYGIKFSTIFLKISFIKVLLEIRIIRLYINIPFFLVIFQGRFILANKGVRNYSD